MNSVGNDNYRPDLVPPKPIRENTGWLSSNMAQLMVFLNGLVLTITAFATLNVFIGEIVREGLLETTESVQEHFFTEYNNAEKSFESLAVLLSQSQNSNSQKIKNYAQSKLKDIGYFEAFYSTTKRDMESGELDLLFAKEEVVLDQKNLSELLKKEDVFSQGTDEETIFLGYMNQEQGNTEGTQSIPVLLASLQNDRLFLAVMKFDNVLKPEWSATDSSVDVVRVLDTESGELIFSFAKDGKEISEFSQYSDTKTGPMADQLIGVEVAMSVGSRESFLQKIPLLMLLFGITLTLIGTLYVRNNQAQSKKLSTMNKELAHKNLELNQQINEGERLNELIQKSAKEHQSIINAVSDIIFELNEEGKITFLNDAWSNVTGFENNRSIGRNFFDLIYVQDQPELKKNFEDLIKNKIQSYRMFTRLRSADGNFRAVELALSMVRQGQDHKLQLAGTITDVEERRRAERALSEAERKYRTIVENAAAGIYQVTPEGQFLSANPAYARILGYSSAEAILRDVENSTEAIYYDPKEHKKFLKDIAALNIAKSREVRIKRQDGEVIWINENVRPVFDDEKNLLYYEGSIENIDQRKQAEIALKEAITESDLANRAKSEFLANMSHELRTPLNAIIGFSDIIRTEAFGKIEQPEYAEYATNIYESGNSLLRVINEILDVSRIEAGERTLNESVVEIHEAVTSCLSLLESKIKSAHVRIDNKIEKGDLSLIGEKQALKQMLINLLSNAIKFSSEDGLITLDAEVDAKGKMRLAITDTGVGMSDDELEKALSPFGQLEADHNRSKSGTGLGLTLVHSLVELHGGELEIVSQRGIGTTATLIFPAKRVAQKKDTPTDSGRQSEEVENT